MPDFLKGDWVLFNYYSRLEHCCLAQVINTSIAGDTAKEFVEIQFSLSPFSGSCYRRRSSLQLLKHIPFDELGIYLVQMEPASAATLVKLIETHEVCRD